MSSEPGKRAEGSGTTGASERTASKRALTQTQRFEALHELAVAAGGLVDPYALARLAVDNARDLLHVDSAGLYWLDTASGLMARLANTDSSAPPPVLRPQEGVAGEAMRTGTTIVVEDYQTWEHRVPGVAAQGVRASAAVPIVVGERPLGALVVRSNRPHRFDSVQLQTLALLAAQVGPVIEVARLYGESERRRREAEGLAALAREGATARDIDHASGVVTEHACRLLGADYGGVVLIEPDGARAWWGVSGSQSDVWASRQPLNTQGPVARALSERQTVVLALAEKGKFALDDLPLHRAEHGRTALATPLVTRQGTLGALLLGWRSDCSLTQPQIQLAEALAGYAAATIENARAHTQEMRRAEELARSEARIRTLYEAVACGVLVLDPAGVITHANSVAEEMLGLSLGQMRGRAPASLWRAMAEDGSELAPQQRPGNLARETKSPVRGFTAGLLRADGDLRWCQIDSVPVLDGNGELSQVVSSFIDITERKRIEEALEHQALHDGLTGLPNRTLLYDRLSQAIRTAIRDKTPLALMIIDLDRFKEVNDTLGHRVGDLLLQQVAERLRDGLREPDTVARTGGDEFAVLLPGADRAGATLVARKLIHEMEQPCLIEEESIPVEGSLGIAIHPEHGTDAETLMRHADVAMYEAKRTASGYAHYNRDQEQRTNLRRVVVSELRQAIEKNQLVLHFQPKVALKTRSVVGVEALVRWEHPEGILIPPERFVPLAEQTGLIEPMTWWVFNAALRQLQQWHARGLSVPVTLNLSTRTLHDPELPNHFSFLARMWHIPEESITIDITESSVMANPARTARMLQGLRSMGLHIAIDDFGTGFSSLSSLGRLPIEELKVDRSFIRTMVADPHDAAIVRAAIDLGHQLGLKVVAQGVEDQATCSLLEVLGCDQAQGHFFCPPLSSTEVEAWLKERGNGSEPHA